MTDTTRTCEHCRWWDYIAHDGEIRMVGLCRRRTPVAMHATNPQRPGEPLWPETEWKDWCGEFEPDSRAAKGGER